jgi:hypothetical protein
VTGWGGEVYLAPGAGVNWPRCRSSVQTESHAYYYLTNFFVTIPPVVLHKLRKRMHFIEKISSGYLRAVEHLAIECGGAVVRVRLAQGRWGIDGNGWDFTVRRAMKG